MFSTVLPALVCAGALALLPCPLVQTPSTPGLVLPTPVPAVQDFCAGADGNLYILELSQAIYEYDQTGRLVRTVPLDLADSGLTASRLTTDPDGNFYLVDGRNGLILKAGASGLLHRSALDPAAVAAEPGLYTELSAPAEDQLCITAFSPDDTAYRTYTLDVSGAQAVCTGQVDGTPLGGGLFAHSALQYNADGALTNGACLTIWQDGQPLDRFSLYTAENCTLFGLKVLGVDTQGRYLLEVFEFLPDGNTVRTSLVRIDRNGGALCTAPSPLLDSDKLRFTGGQTYVLRQADGRTSLFPLSALAPIWQETDRFTLAAPGDLLGR